MGTTTRAAARLVVVDVDGRVLLLRYDDPPPMGVHWATPGGGIEPGETEREAALRELGEETGWTELEVGEELGRTQRVVERRAGPVVQDEVHLAVRLPDAQRPLDEAGHGVDEIAGWAWLTRAEVAALDVPVWPRELPDLLALLEPTTR